MHDMNAINPNLRGGVGGGGRWDRFDDSVGY